MKNLMLIRHAKSSWKDHNLPDIKRPLNKRGNRDAPFMGRLIKTKYNINPEMAVSSRAVRASETAKIFCREIGLAEEKLFFTEKLYLADPADMLEVINSVDDSVGTLLIFAHNPGLTDLANMLSGKYIDNIPTAGVVGLIFEDQSWSRLKKGTCKPAFFEYPKMYLSRDDE